MIFDRIYDDLPPQMKILNLVVNSNALLQFRLKLERFKPHKAVHTQRKCDVINDVKLFRTGYTVAIFDVIQSDIGLQNQVH